MSMTINDSVYNYLTQTAQNANSSAASGAVNETLSGINENSTEAEMKQAIKDFESYFVEQILKQVKETFTEDEDSPNSQLTDFFMGQVGEQMADRLIDDVGGRMTQTLYEQLCRNYSMNIPKAGDSEA